MKRAFVCCLIAAAILLSSACAADPPTAESEISKPSAASYETIGSDTATVEPTPSSESTVSDKTTEEESDFVFRSYRNGWQISAGKVLTGKTVVPAERDGKPVLRIANGGFAGQTAITEILLPEGLLSIGERAFEGCSAIKTVELPESVTTLSAYAFSDCECLSLLKLSPNVKTIPSHCISRCALETLVFPEGLEELGSESVANCTKLKRIFLPSTLVRMGESFYNCPIRTVEISNLSSYCLCEGRMRPAPKGERQLILDGKEIEDLILPDGLPEIKLENAFSSINLRSVSLPSSLRKISDGAFGSNDIENVDLSEVRMIGSAAFAECPITHVDFSKALRKIGSGAFYSCPIADLYLPSSLVEIGGSAFSGTKSERIVLPEGIQKLGENVFGKELKELVIPSTITEFYPFSTAPALEKMIYMGTPDQLKRVKKVVHANGTFSEMKEDDPMPEFFVFANEEDNA